MGRVKEIRPGPDSLKWCPIEATALRTFPGVSLSLTARGDGHDPHLASLSHGDEFKIRLIFIFEFFGALFRCLGPGDERGGEDFERFFMASAGNFVRHFDLISGLAGVGFAQHRGFKTKNGIIFILA